jgi:hypothetical protein
MRLSWLRFFICTISVLVIFCTKQFFDWAILWGEGTIVPCSFKTNGHKKKLSSQAKKKNFFFKSYMTHCATGMALYVHLGPKCQKNLFPLF